MISRQPRAKASRGFSHFRHVLAACIATRLVVDTSIQLFFSFLQTIALGMALDVVVLGRLLSLRSVVGLSAPLFGSAADRYGYLRVMRLALVLSAAGTFLLGSGAGLWSVAAGMVVSGGGLTGFVPTSQAYISAQLPFAKRARGIGILEYSWALAGIFGLSLMGLLFDRFNWQLPFIVLGTAMLAGWALLGLLPKASRDAEPTPTGASEETVPAPAAVASVKGGPKEALEKGVKSSLSPHSSLLASCGVSPTCSISAPTGARPTQSSVQTASSFSARAMSSSLTASGCRPNTACLHLPWAWWPYSRARQIWSGLFSSP